MTADEVITDARDLHPTFTDNEHPNASCVRTLSRLQQALYAETLERYPGWKNATEDIAMPLADHAAGVALPLPLSVIDLTRTNADNSRAPVPIIPYEHRFDDPGPPVHQLRSWMQGGQLYLSARASDWNGVQKLTLRFAGALDDLTSLDDVITLPSLARSALVSGLGQFMASRGSQRTDVSAPSVSYFSTQYSIERERYLTGLWLLRSAEVQYIRDITG